MRKKNRFLIYPLIVIGFVLIIANSCKKDETIASKKDPIITWANPADITVGELLSAAQLNATADVAGTFVYTPSIGASLSVGANQDLKVDFTPTVTATYNVASKTVKINVTELAGDGGVSSAVFNTTKTYGTMTDQNGNTYKTITIGTQTWMAENLRVTKYRNGDAIPNITDNAVWVALTTGAYCSYENTIDKDKIATYGRLYNWFTVADSRNIAPTGWHVPTYADWIILNNFLGGYEVAGGKMKESGLTHWADPNTGADNSSGFTALPAGLRYLDDTFGNLSYTCTFWSSTENVDDVSRAWRNGIYYIYSNSLPGDDIKQYGYSIRCIKD